MPAMRPFVPFLLAGAMLVACATPKSPPADLFVDPAPDLAAVRDDALSLAQHLGAERVLVVFDLDNTLLAMEQDLGADQWYDFQSRLGKEDPCDGRFVGDVLAAQGALYFASAMRPTQPEAPDLVREIQAAGLPVIALTSRGPEFRLPTFRELRRSGYSFAASGIGSPAHLGDTFTPPSGTRGARYEDGVFLTAGQHKGDMLRDLLDLTDTPLPAVIVMADDKARNLQAVVETFAPLGVTVHAWRFAGEDQRVAQFDGATTVAQWQEVQEALLRLEALFGPDNFSLAAARRVGNCLQ